MVKVNTIEEARSLPQHMHDVGFSQYYEVDGESVAVPKGATVPDHWELISE